MKKYLILILFLCCGTASANFSDGYEVANWSQSLDGGIIDLSGAPGQIEIISSDSGNDDGNIFLTNFTIAALADGVVNFEWDVFGGGGFGQGPVSDNPFGWLLNGVFTQLTDNAGGDEQTGITMFNVLAGEIFGFSQGSLSEGTVRTTISSFSAPLAVLVPPPLPPSTVPVPAAAWLFGSALLGFFGFSRRKANA